MYEITKEIQFDAGHRVPNHRSKCRNPHGHRYRVVLHLQGELVSDSGSSDEGMLMDFSDVKAILTEKVHDWLDHGFIVYQGDHSLLSAFQKAEKEWGLMWRIIVFPYIPTAENIARWVWHQVRQDIRDHYNENLKLYAIEVWETPTSMATYYGGA